MASTTTTTTVLVCTGPILWSLMVMFLVAATPTVTAHPLVISVRHASSRPYQAFCSSSSHVQKVFNIGHKLYVYQNSFSILEFDLTTKKVQATSNSSNETSSDSASSSGLPEALEPKRYSLQTLFGKNTFKWVDTVISLNRFCEASGQCGRNNGGQDQDREGWSDLERLHIAIGQRVLKDNYKDYRYALYDLDPVSGDFKMVAEPSEGLKQKLAQIGLPQNNSDEHIAPLMMGPFWPNVEGDLYYQSALYVPSRGELFFNVYNSRESTIHQIVRGRFVANRVGVQWEDTNYNDQLTRMHVTLGFFGMFSLGQGGEQRYFGMDKSNTVFEFVYSPSGEVNFRNIGPLKEVLNCYQNSSQPEFSTATTATTTTSLTTAMSPGKEDTGDVVLVPIGDNALDTPLVHKSSTTNHPSSSTTSAEIQDHSARAESESTQDKEREEDSPATAEGEELFSVSELDDNGVAVDHHHPQNDNPAMGQAARSKAGNSSSASSSSSPSLRTSAADDGGVLWTMAILIGVLFLLAAMVLVPILIIRNKSRTNRMCISKASKYANNKNGNNMNGSGGGGSGNGKSSSEEVQLMHSFSFNDK